MPTTARLITRPYTPATCRVNVKGRRVDRGALVMWACIIIGGWIASELLFIAIDSASEILAGR